MARKLKSPAAATPPSASDAKTNPLEDLYVILPDVKLTLAGRDLTVREYRFADGMHARAKAGPLIEDLQALTESGEAREAGLETYVDLLAQHDSLVRELMTTSIDGADADFIDSLSYADGQQLLMTWWSVTGHFFWRVVVGRMRDRALTEMRRQMKERSHVGQTSSSPLPAPPAPNTATSPTDTPNVN